MGLLARHRLPFTIQLLVLQLVVIVVVVLLGFGLFAGLLERGLTAAYGERALAIARSVAADSELRQQVADLSDAGTAGPATAAALAAGPVQHDAEAARTSTGALFVVVTDDRGIRLSHPDVDQLGLPVSTDPSVALGGDEEVVRQVGTLGESARAKVPVFDLDGTTVVGAVSVGIATAEISAALWSDLRATALYAAVALGLGALASVLLARRLRRLTLGVEPEELAGLVSEHRAVLDGIGEGVVGLDRAGRVSVANDEAVRLLGAAVRPGAALADLGWPTRLRTLVAEQQNGRVDAPPAGPELVLTGERVLVCTVARVSRDGRDLGVVVSARDRTDVESLTRQLDAVQTMGTALRAQRHEFANRLHVVHGLLAQGHLDEAGYYVRSVLGSGPLGTLLDGVETIRDPTLQAFLSAKAAHARERSVNLRIGAETWLNNSILEPVAVTTVLGNLLDNAVDAAATGRQRPAPEAWVEVELLTDAGQLYLTVCDSGDGVPEHLRDRLFEENVSGKPSSPLGAGRGLGLALVRQIARVVGGDVWLADPGNANAGAVFVARLPGVLSESAVDRVPATRETIP